MEAQDELHEYRPREDKPNIVLTSAATKVPLRTWLIFAFIAAVGLVNAVLANRVDIIAAVIVPLAFLFVGIRIVMRTPVKTIVSFLDEGLELETPGHGWVQVPWERITRLVKDGLGGASLDTGTVAEGGRTVARLPKAELEKLLAASLLPAHVEFVEVAVAAAPRNSKKVFVLWLCLIGIFVTIWQLVVNK